MTKSSPRTEQQWNSLSKFLFLCLILLFSVHCSKKKPGGLGLGVLALAGGGGSSSSSSSNDPKKNLMTTPTMIRNLMKSKRKLNQPSNSHLQMRIKSFQTATITKMLIFRLLEIFLKI